MGKAALEAQKEQGLTRKLVQFTLADPAVKLYMNEPVYRDGVQISQIRSGAYGFKVGSAVGMGYLTNPDGITNAWIEEGRYEVMVEGQLIPAKVHLRAPYDPKAERTKM